MVWCKRLPRKALLVPCDRVADPAAPAHAPVFPSGAIARMPGTARASAARMREASAFSYWSGMVDRAVGLG
ncbi:hypothetical protein MAFF301560_05700 [Ralstonia solanacearum]|nr:hypothetical protein MAFF301560_05700 [Ralstonia solanacearum]BEU48066.1 hypothetical protein MAFF211519_33910 [Ralstonia pseudosolanacearum]